jgi:hypothetical protein
MSIDSKRCFGLAFFFTLFTAASLVAADPTPELLKPANAPPTNPIPPPIKAYELTPDGQIELKLSKEDWRLSGVIVKTRSDFSRENILYTTRVTDDAAVAFDVRRALAQPDAERKDRGPLPATRPIEPSFDMVIGGKGASALETVTAFLKWDVGPGSTIPYRAYGRIAGDPKLVRWALPFAVGDTYRDFPVVATLRDVFGIDSDNRPLPDQKAFEYAPGKRLKLAQGRPFNPSRFEVVLGGTVAAKSKLNVGGKLKIAHGRSTADWKPEVHAEEWTVVGILETSDSVNDTALFVPLIAFYAIPEHFEALSRMAQMRSAAEKSAK